MTFVSHPIRMASAALASRSAMGLDVVECVLLVKRVAVLAMRFTRHVVRTVCDAIVLVVGVAACGQVCCRVVCGIAVKVSDLARGAAFNKVFADQTVNQEPAILARSSQADVPVPLGVDIRAQNSAGKDICASPVADRSGCRSNVAEGRDLVVGIPFDRLPLFHSDILLGGE